MAGGKMDEKTPLRPKPNVFTTDKNKAQGWQKTLGAALGVCLAVWMTAVILMLMVWSLLWMYTNLFG